MLKNVLLIGLACIVALAGGTASVAYVLASNYNFGAVKVGGWTTYPELGTHQADPYAQAEVAIGGILSLGRAEGLAFAAERDEAGEPLDSSCSYLLAGQTPPARFWTLRAEPLADARTAQPGPALQSRSLLRHTDNSFEVAVGRRPEPGNWLPVTVQGRLRLVLTVYDSSANSGPVSNSLAMPVIRKAACGA